MVLERNQFPLLQIDCGYSSLRQHRRYYTDALPRALFITHCHWDHIGGLEQLFYQTYFSDDYRGQIKLYVPIHIISLLHQRIADYPGNLAEGGVNFWDNFRLIPVSHSFWHEGLKFQVFPVRHHEYGSAYGIALRGVFLYSGDTRPIPELISTFAAQGETIFHDCSLEGSPSHSGIQDIIREYRSEQVQRMIFYHLADEQARQQIHGMGHRVARSGELIPLRYTGIPMGLDINGNTPTATLSLAAK